MGTARYGDERVTERRLSGMRESSQNLDSGGRVAKIAHVPPSDPAVSERDRRGDLLSPSSREPWAGVPG